MDERQWAATAEFIERAFSTTPGNEFDEAREDLYGAVLGEYDFEDVQQALLALVAKGERYVPALGVIVERLTNQKYPPWGRAWEDIRRIVAKYGARKRNEGIEALGASFRLYAVFAEREGWMHLCTFDTDSSYALSRLERAWKALCKEDDDARIEWIARRTSDRLLEGSGLRTIDKGRTIAALEPGGTE